MFVLKLNIWLPFFSVHRLGATELAVVIIIIPMTNVINTNNIMSLVTTVAVMISMIKI